MLQFHATNLIFLNIHLEDKLDLHRTVIRHNILVKSLRFMHSVLSYSIVRANEWKLLICSLFTNLCPIPDIVIE